MKAQGVDVGALAAEADRLRHQGRTVVFLGIDGKSAGASAVGDPVKETTPAVLHDLRSNGLRLIMLTGDNQATARAVAADLPIDEVIAEVQPQDKADVVARLQKQGRRVAMAGDGSNDAPALAQAALGVLSPLIAALAMSLSSISVIGNALRLRTQD